MIIEFYKYQGTGNDFVIIDDRDNTFPVEDNEIVAVICERRMGVGADGLILLRNHNKYDFEMIYFNSDGNQSSMCGNGGRCIVAFAAILGIIDDEAEFIAIDGVHKAKLTKEGVFLQMRDVKSIERRLSGLFLNTGSPHYVQMVDAFTSCNVDREGREIRNSADFSKDGVNVNFVLDADPLEVRTYERGVESETLSCGTGVVAAVIAMHYSNIITDSIIDVKTKGGVLSVDFEEFNGFYRNIWLSGDVSMVYAGEFEC